MELVETGRTLEELEDVIDRGAETFIAVGLALLEIRDRKLYRERGYGSFANYVAGEWDFGARRAYQLIDAVITARALGDGDVNHGSQLPERQTRALSTLAKKDPQAARAVLASVREEAEAEGVPVTTALLERKVNVLAAPSAPEVIEIEGREVAEPEDTPDVLGVVMWARVKVLTMSPEDAAIDVPRSQVATMQAFLVEMRRWLDDFEAALQRQQNGTVVERT